MAIEKAGFIWKNGEMAPWEEATVHVLSHTMHYGSCVFEGIRAYKTAAGPVFFRLEDHLRRLYDSARMYDMEPDWSPDELQRACHQLMDVNELEDAYIRPLFYHGFGSLGVLPGPTTPLEATIAAFHWGAYLGDRSREEGVDVGVSSWRRPAPDTTPAMAKAGGNYLNSALISAEAKRHGYHEGIALDTRGYLSEGAGENLFLIRDNVLYTPSLSCSILGGITRDSVIKLAQSLSYKVIEADLPREMLYLADEIFLTGTAAEVVPVRSVDGKRVGTSGRGPITKELQLAFFGLFHETTVDQWGWLEKVAGRELEPNSFW